MADRLHHRAIARLSTEYVATLLCEGVAETGLDVLDFAIVLLVSAGSIGRLTDTPAARPYDHGSDGPVPQELMTPTSLTTIEECLKLSPQVARERLQSLTDRQILRTVGEAGFIMGDPVNTSEAAARLADKNAALARRFAKRLSSATA